MKISIIVAMASNRVIGNQNQLPWHLPADLKRFKSITLGSPIIMGRKTFESIGRPLPGRSNIIISNNPDFSPADCLVFNAFEKALDYCAPHYKEVFIIGGFSLYQSSLPLADTLYITQINQEFAGDTLFPAVNMDAWQEVSKEEINVDPEAAFSYSFLKYAKL